MSIEALTWELREDDLPPDICCHVLGSCYTLGGDPVDGTCPLAVALLECWPCDTHITQYVCDPAVRATKANKGRCRLTFDFCCFDLDFHFHKQLPSEADFQHLVELLTSLRFVPNLAYPTRRGARIVFLVKSVSDADWFEVRTTALMKDLAKPIAQANSGYLVDLAAKDWTRLYRSARVVRLGKHGCYVEEFDRPIRMFHTRRLDLAEIQMQQKQHHQPRQAVSNLNYNAFDLPLLKMLNLEMREGTRNATSFKAICYALRTFTPDGAEEAIDAVREAALAAGLPESEFERVLWSARNQQRD